MTTEPFKPELRLIFQGSIPIAKVAEGEEFYKNLKKIIQNYSPDPTLNGQIMKRLEPCCKEIKEQKPNEKPV